MCPWIYFIITFVLWLLECLPLAFSAFTAHFPEGAHPPSSAPSPVSHAAGQAQAHVYASSVRWVYCSPPLLRDCFTSFRASVLSSVPCSPLLSPPFPASLLKQLGDPPGPPYALQRFWVGTQERVSLDIGVILLLTGNVMFTVSVSQSC